MVRAAEYPWFWLRPMGIARRSTSRLRWFMQDCACARSGSEEPETTSKPVRDVQGSGQGMNPRSSIGGIDSSDRASSSAGARIISERVELTAKVVAPAKGGAGEKDGAAADDGIATDGGAGADEGGRAENRAPAEDVASPELAARGKGRASPCANSF